MTQPAQQLSVGIPAVSSPPRTFFEQLPGVDPSEREIVTDRLTDRAAACDLERELERCRAGERLRRHGRRDRRGHHWPLRLRYWG